MNVRVVKTKQVRKKQREEAERVLRTLERYGERRDDFLLVSVLSCAHFSTLPRETAMMLEGLERSPCGNAYRKP